MAKKKSNKKKRFKGGVSRNAAKQSRGTQYGHLNLPKGVNVFKEEPKTRVNLDIMPYEVKDPHHLDRDDEYETAVPGELWYKRPYLLHRNIGPNNDTVVCPTTAKRKCPICENRAQSLKDGADWNDESVKALKPSMRNLYIVTPKGHKDYDEKFHVWDISQFLFQEKLNEEIQENEEHETFPDLEEGYTLRIRFSEEQLGNNKFADTSRIDFVDRKEPYDESILEEIPSLDEIIIVPTYKTVEALFFGGLSQEEIEDEEDYDEDDDIKEEPQDDEEEEEEDEEEEEQDDNDDDDEDGKDEEEAEEEEEEEEKPKRKGAKVSKGTKGKEKGKDKGKAKDKKDKGKKKNKCPHGHEFGKDCEEHDECDECDEWESCMDASESE